MPTISVLGATGRIGRATALALAARGAHVRAVAHRTAPDAELEQAATVVRADLRNRQALADALAGSDAVQVICPVPATAPDLRRDAEITIDALVRALQAARPAAVVVISDYGAEIPAGTGITTIFHSLESRLGHLPSQVTFLRSAEHMHNWTRQLPATLTTGVLASMHQPLTKLFPTVHAPDVGLEAADLLLSPTTGSGAPRIVYVEGPRRYTVQDVAAALQATTGRQITARELPRPDWEKMLLDAGAAPASAQLIAELYDAHNRGCIDTVAGAEIRYTRTDLHDALAIATARC